MDVADSVTDFVEIGDPLDVAARTLPDRLDGDLTVNVRVPPAGTEPISCEPAPSIQ